MTFEELKVGDIFSIDRLPKVEYTTNLYRKITPFNNKVEALRCIFIGYTYNNKFITNIVHCYGISLDTTVAKIDPKLYGI